ncbi:MAG: PEP/pyruvate-binding domain-containing protein [Spirochaetes bacterium]|nr:PEP/pyruvate-binding domain-containing protein [Spirochaetota bacterium]
MECSTGLPGLDKILHGIRPGDNIVWQIDKIDDYISLVIPYCEFTKVKGEKLTYFRFAKHKELVPKQYHPQVVKLNPEEGFEKFITTIHKVIEENGEGGYYVFDSHTDLTNQNFSDHMLGNFFKLTCPFLYKYKTITYFGVFRHYHSYHAASPMAETTQLLLDCYNHKGSIYVHPLKVDGRYSPTMYMLHKWEGDDFIPITESAIIAEVLKHAPWHGLQSSSYRMVGIWDRKFMQAEELLQSYKEGSCSKQSVTKIYHHLLTQLISRDEQILSLAKKYMTLSDIIYVWKRLIGSGQIGGKSVGMLLARGILEKTDPRWKDLLEAHDSFYIGSDVFYSFLVQNGCWELRQKQKDPDDFLKGAEEARKLILNGNFPDYLIQRFSDMLKYYGQTPIIVRSSSLLEDNYGNAFAGKYESVFCANQGTHEQILEEFVNAVKIVYASTMSKEALSYRAKRGVLDKDEQMALLVQRVSGATYGNLFFPQLAGVGFSFNPYVWNESIDPEAGMLRIVFGLGTRAVDRADDDYTRVVALNEPDKRPESTFDQVKRYAQRRVDFIDLKENRFTSGDFVDVARKSDGLELDNFATIDMDLVRYAKERGRTDIQPWVLTFQKIFSETPLIKDIREMFRILKEAYKCQVDVELTTNFLSEDEYKIDLLQCRPLHVKENVSETGEMPIIKKENLIMETHGGVVGQSRLTKIDRMVYVVPALYGKLAEQDRYAVARLIGNLTHFEEKKKPKTIMLFGPGRWGTNMPSLGVPVKFSEINTVTVLCEIDIMHEGLVPDLSLGTHFFNELVEMNMLYMAFFAAKEDNFFNDKLLLKAPNQLEKMFPKESFWKDMIRVVNSEDISKKNRIYLSADTMKQVALLYISK